MTPLLKMFLWLPAAQRSSPASITFCSQALPLPCDWRSPVFSLRGSRQVALQPSPDGKPVFSLVRVRGGGLALWICVSATVNCLSFGQSLTSPRRGYCHLQKAWAGSGGHRPFLTVGWMLCKGPPDFCSLHPFVRPHPWQRSWRDHPKAPFLHLHHCNPMSQVGTGGLHCGTSGKRRQALMSAPQRYRALPWHLLCGQRPGQRAESGVL